MMYMSSWDKSSLESYKAKCEKLEKENEKYIITFSSLYDNERQYTKKISEQEDSLGTMSGQLVELKNTIKIKQMTISELKECLLKKDFENEHLKSKVVDFTTARALAEATLREKDELIFAQCEKIRLLEEQCEPFYEVHSEFDSEIVLNTQDNSEKDLILSLQTQVKETAELVVRFSDEKYFALQEIESLKDEIKNVDQMKSQVSELMEKLQILDQEMKQQIILFEEDKRMFLDKNEFMEKVSSSVQKEYNDLLASNDVLKQRLETKFKFLKHDNSLEKMFEMIEQEYESNTSKISITSSTIETKNLELVKEMGDKVKRFDDEKKVFENKISKMEKLASQNYTSLQKENNDLRSYNVLKEKHETSCEKHEKENNDLKMHYKSLFDSIKQKKVVSQVFTKSIPKVNVSEKIYTGKSSKPILKKVSQFTTYSLQKDRKYLKKRHSSKTFASQNHEKNESSKQIWKRKGENISKRFKYYRDEMFSMRKRDDSVLEKVKDVRFPFISKRIFQNETPSFNDKWKSSSSSRVKTSNETPGFKTVFTPLRNFKTPNETSRFYKSNWTNEKSFKSPLIPRKLFQNETPGFKSPWNSTSMHQIDATYIWFSKYGKPVSNVLKWVPKVVA
ncbi:hypothetical protein Tco_1508828 [Tanacetum coccineum]